MSSIYHFNQEQPLTGLTNTQVSDLVSSNLPENTYTSIAVNSINYRFPLTEEPIQARHISLKISHVAVGWSSLKVFPGRMLNVHVAHIPQVNYH
ncbi:hypothetical protein [Neochlamydia sp. S13]|uniref:hypothetical protein n=1 Tax=Neochlamydia sp. S13 TaxID=1353976 RepID=UPI0005A7D559|nr:hypothetical protein [Neochlamydia sp. S13]BBI16903.1 hypothetical protein NCS13_1_0708 [Neochlamydia sp. S13]